MAHSIKPPYPIFPLTPFSQSLYSYHALFSPSLPLSPYPPSFPALLCFPTRSRNAKCFPFDLGSASSSSSSRSLAHSLASIRHRFLPALRCRHRSLSLDRHHASLSFWLSPLLVKRYESPPSTRAAVDAARFARLQGFRQQRPTKTALTDVRRAPCRRVYTRANYDPLSRRVYEERASCCLPVAAGFTTETRPGRRTDAGTPSGSFAC